MHHHHYSDHPSSLYPHQKDPATLAHVFSSASSVLNQMPPPTLRDILGAYKANGEGDRDMLLAMLNAKTAEDQRIASMAALQRTMLEIYQQTAPLHMNGDVPPPSREPRHPRRTVYRSVSRSPPEPRMPLPALGPRTEHRRKRARSSRSPPPSAAPRRHGSLHDGQHSELPPSPYSSSGSDSAGYSPRSRTSMTIGSLLQESNSGEAGRAGGSST
ncbi:hypothetical protein FB45DRAFT_916054 [Roridomyces roridus]|uniref:Uncharacterized protein n=1 Tax=Roridomyces roridus TaxID=1738132 RepID=A0AAD7FNK3_9AGAR|nr:hypothetical protein FB45DRAFT_916054 [Roridomyces roridus]